MVGQCVFCSWYGIRLRRAPASLGIPALYHSHCVRAALQSPHPQDRARAEEIVRVDLPNALRDRFWALNPPNRTVRTTAGVIPLSREECVRICRTVTGTAGEVLYDLLTDPSVLPAAVMPPDGSGPAALPELERELGEEAQRGESAPFRLALPPVSLSPESRCSSAGDPAPLRRGSRTAVGRALKLARGISRSERRQRPERVAAHPAAGGGAPADPESRWSDH